MSELVFLTIICIIIKGINYRKSSIRKIIENIINEPKLNKIWEIDANTIYSKKNMERLVYKIYQGLK